MFLPQTSKTLEKKTNDMSPVWLNPAENRWEKPHIEMQFTRQLRVGGLTVSIKFPQTAKNIYILSFFRNDTSKTIVTAIQFYVF
jgi:hypothetical protein